MPFLMIRNDITKVAAETTTMVVAAGETAAAAAVSSPLRWWSCWCLSPWEADSSPAGETQVLPV